MSDNEEEYEYDYGSDQEYDYGSDDGENEGDNGNDELIEIENSFYGTKKNKLIPLMIRNISSSSLSSYLKLSNNDVFWLFLLLEGDDLRKDDPVKAIEMFEKVVAMESQLGSEVKW